MVERAKEKCTKDSDSNLLVVSTDVFGGYCNWCWRTGHKEAQCWLKQGTQRAIHHKTRCQETFVNGRTQQRKGKVTASPKVKVKARGKRRHPGKGNHNQDQAGSPDDETGQRRLDDFGITRQRDEFVGDVQEHTDAQNGSSSLCVFRSKVQECHDGLDGIAKFVKESFFQVCVGVRSQRALMIRKVDQSTGELLFAVGR